MQASPTPQEQVDDAYRAVGRYIVKFSNLMSHMRHLAARRVAPEMPETDLAELLLGEAMPTPLMKAFFGLCRHVTAMTQEEVAVSNVLEDEVTKVITMRNHMAHGDWWIGLLGDDYPDETPSDPELVRLLPGQRKDGPIKEMLLPPSELDPKSSRLGELRTLVAEFGVLALGLPVLRLDPDGSIHTAQHREFRVSDVLTVHGTAKKEKAYVVRDGPKADVVHHFDYSQLA